MNTDERLRAVFRKRFPRLLPRLESAAKIDAKATVFSGLREGSEDWPALLDRWLAGVELKPNAAIALTGFGDGNHVAALLEKLPKGSFVFCAEEDVSGFRAIAQGEEVLRILKDPRFFLGLGKLDQDCFEALSRFPTLEIQDACPIVFAPIYNASPDYYGAFFTEFARAVEYWRKLFGTNVTASGKWQKNTFANVDSLIAAPDLGVLKDAFKGGTIIIASAGPSLDESLEFIAENQDRCVVVAVNSSFRALRNAGITPHFVLAADPYVFTEKGFEGVDCEGTNLICPFIVYPKVVDHFSGRVFTWSQNNLLASYIRLKLGLGMGSEILEMGTVSACIFDVAKLFGCRRIVFAGQDLAVKADGQSHARDSFYSDLNANSVATQSCRAVPGNVEETVLVEEKLFVYLKTFEQLVKEEDSGLELWNTSRFGARIEGIPYISLDEIWLRLKTETAPSILSSQMGRVETILSSQEDLSAKLNEELDSISKFARNTSALALKGALSLEVAFPENESPVADRIKTAESCKRELIALFEKESDLHTILNDGALKYEMMLYASAQRHLDSIEDPGRRDAEDLKEYFWAVAEGAYSFMNSLQGARTVDVVA